MKRTFHPTALFITDAATRLIGAGGHYAQAKLEDVITEVLLQISMLSDHLVEGCDCEVCSSEEPDDQGGAPPSGAVN